MFLVVDVVGNTARACLFDQEGNLKSSTSARLEKWNSLWEEVLKEGTPEAVLGLSVPYLSTYCTLHKAPLKDAEEALELEVERGLPCTEGKIHAELIETDLGTTVILSLLSEAFSEALKEIEEAVKLEAVMPRPMALFNAVANERIPGISLAMELTEGVLTFAMCAEQEPVLAGEVDVSWMPLKEAVNSVAAKVGTVVPRGKGLKLYQSGFPEEALEPFLEWDLEKVELFGDFVEGLSGTGVLKGLYLLGFEE